MMDDEEDSSGSGEIGGGMNQRRSLLSESSEDFHDDGISLATAMLKGCSKTLAGARQTGPLFKICIPCS